MKKHYTAEVRGFPMKNLRRHGGPPDLRDSSLARSRRGIGGAPRLEVIAAIAIADVELIPHEGKQHGVRAIQQLPVFDRLEVQLGKDVRRAPSVPAETVAGFRREAGRVAHDWEYTTRALQ